MKDQKEKLGNDPITIATKRIKYVRINRLKEAKDQYSENCNLLTKETKVDTNRLKDIFLDWKNQYCENDYTTQRIYRFNTIPVKLLMAFFIELKQKFLQFVWKHERSQIAKVILRKKI